MAVRKKSKPKKRKVVCKAPKKRRVVSVKKKGRKKPVKKVVCRAPKRKRPGAAPAPVSPPVAAAPAGAVLPDPPPPPPAPPPAPVGPKVESPIERYTGTFGPKQAERLLWRAGFGPRPGDVARVAAMGLDAAVTSLTRPQGNPVMEGAEPIGRNGGPLSPIDVTGDDVLWWMDRMIRSNHQLVERMSLVLHDWFATSISGYITQYWMLLQNNLFRRHGFGSFKSLVHDITRDGAMIQWLDLDRSFGGKPNENYARELMELFTLGADRGAYTEDDIREAARALTGMTIYYEEPLGENNPRVNPSKHDKSAKTVFGQTGAFNWADIARMVVDHPLHAGFFVPKLWSYFIPTPPSASEAGRLQELYVSSGYQIRPVLEAILTSRPFYEGPSMVKPPVVQVVGMHRATRQTITGEDWRFQLDTLGQRLFMPPDVAGWDESRWLDTNTMNARWTATYTLMKAGGHVPKPDLAAYPAAETPEQALDSALTFWNHPPLTQESRALLLEYARTSVGPTGDSMAHGYRQNALRHLIAGSPDYQIC